MTTNNITNIYQYHPDGPSLYPPQSVTNTTLDYSAPAPSADDLPPTGFQPQPAIAIAFLLIFMGAVMLYKLKMVKKAYAKMEDK